MKIVIAGGSGHLGSALAQACYQRGDQVVVLSRQPMPAPWSVVGWDGRSGGDWEREIDGADVVVNLAGRSVNCRYTTANCGAILASRIDSTLAVAAAIARAAEPPPVWLQASTATIYAHRFDGDNDEHGPLGGSETGTPPSWRFSTAVGRAWEAAADAARVPRTRVVLMRSAIVLGPSPGGIFEVLLDLVRRGLGGPVGSGRQYVSWIHVRDWLAAIDRLIADGGFRGPVNLAAPHPLPNAAFMRALREAWGMPIGLPAPGAVLALGTRLLRTESELVLKSRRVVPGILLARGFAWEFTDWPAAARDLCAQVRAREDVRQSLVSA
jgi:uncharacterized protein (TIGR01777 family)